MRIRLFGTPRRGGTWAGPREGVGLVIEWQVVFVKGV